MKRIYARDTEVRRVSAEDAINFLNEHHNQKWIASAVYYGLYWNDELVQIESFGMPRIEVQNNITNHDWELLRECSKKDYYIIGGKSKLLKAFEREYKPLSLLSYCDTTAGFDGHSYAACGFVLDRVSTDYWYEFNGNKIKRYEMQRNSRLRAAGKMEPIEKTLKKYGKLYDPNLSERENAEKAGFTLVRGQGQQSWTKYYSDNIGYVYEVVGPDGKTYIGKHILRKDGVAKAPNYWASGTYILAATKKYGKKAFKRRAIYWTTDLIDLADKELCYIDEYSKHYGKENMYNLDFREKSATTNLWQFDKDKYDKANDKRSTSLANYWANLSEEDYQRRCQAMSKMNKGRILSELHRQRIADGVRNSEAHKLAMKSVETRQKISEALKGHTISEETKKKISESLKGNPSTQTEDYRKNMSAALLRVREEAIKWIHDNGFLTREDLMKKHNLTYRQLRAATPIGRYKRINYYKDA